jgi:hypothetical protein
LSGLGGLALGYGPVGGLVRGLSYHLPIGLGVGLVAGIAAGLVSGRRQPARVIIDRTLLRTLRGATGFGLAAGLLAGLAAGSQYGLATGLAGGLLFGLAVLASVGLAFGVMRESDQLPESDRLPSPGATLRADRRATAVSVLAGGLLFGPGLAAGQVLVRFPGDPGITLVAGVAIGLLLAAGRPWPWYQLIRMVYAINGRLPWHLMTFLEEAHRRGLLRQVGAVYQFRHARLQDHLLQMAPGSDKALAQAAIDMRQPATVS